MPPARQTPSRTASGAAAAPAAAPAPGGTNSTAPPGLTKLIDDNFVGILPMELSCLTLTSLVRPLSDVGIDKVKNSIEAAGWLNQFAPTVMVDADDAPSDKLKNAVHHRSVRGCLLAHKGGTRTGQQSPGHGSMDGSGR